jgi:hypothetical protein
VKRVARIYHQCTVVPIKHDAPSGVTFGSTIARENSAPTHQLIDIDCDPQSLIVGLMLCEASGPFGHARVDQPNTLQYMEVPCTWPPSDSQQRTLIHTHASLFLPLVVHDDLSPLHDLYVSEGALSHHVRGRVIFWGG